MNSEKIGFVETIALITIIMINKIILNTPKDIIASTGSSAWLNTIYISLIAVALCVFLAYLLKNFKGYDILDISDFVGGKFLKVLVGLLYIVLFMFFYVFVIKNLAETLRIIYFKTTPILYLLLFFIISSWICSRFQLKVLAKANLIIAPVIFLSVIVILLSSLENFVPQRIFPILGYGVNETFFSGLSNIFSFSGLLFLLFLNPLIDNPTKLKRISIISVIISAIYLFLSVSCLLFSVSFTLNSEESFSLYVLTRNIEYGRFIQRVDALFILVWIISIISYINIPIYFCIRTLKRLTKLEDTSTISYSIHFILLALLLVPYNYADFKTIIYSSIKDMFFVLFFAISIPILIYANLKLRRKRISKKVPCNTNISSLN